MERVSLRGGWLAALTLSLSSAAGALGEPPRSAVICDSSSDRLVLLTDSDGSGLVELGVPGEIAVYYDDSSSGPDLSTPSHMALGPGETLYLLDGGTLDAVLVLDDSNGDGDALDEGEVRVFYDASAGGPKLSTPNTLIVLPGGELIVSDDGSRGRRLVVLADRNADGDALDPDEARVAYDARALSLPVLEDVEALALRPDGSVVAGDTTLQGLFVLRDLDGDGDFLDEGEQTELFRSRDDLALGDIDALAVQGARVFSGDSDTGRIIWLEDLNGDGDAMDEGEAGVFLGDGAAVRVGSVTDFMPLPGGGFLVLDNSKDAVVVAADLNGDGDALDEGEVFRWLADDGSTFATPSGVVVPLRDEPPPPPPARFLRGDATGDAKLDISDAVAILGYLFLGRPAGSCMDALDSDDTGKVEITDAIFLLSFLFSGGAQPPAPHPEPGGDPTGDPLDC
ncbi:MAG: hypothetical protein HY721_13220 [Planctomycetes bacterium]|nr:hypothetical protein [Planctomycetota bacterium]